MNVAVVGTGYVGLVVGACLAETGNNVICADVDNAKIDLLNANEIPIHEPGLPQLVEHNKRAGRLSFTTDVADAVERSEIVFIAVGTPLVPVQHFNIVCEGSPGEPRVLEDDDNFLGFGTRQYRQGGVGWDFCKAVVSLVPVVNEVLGRLVAGDTLGPVSEEQRRVVDVAQCQYTVVQ